MDIVFLILYILTASINIFAIQDENRIIRFVSKICLMPILMAFYIYKSDNHSLIIILALSFSWAADIMLVNPGKYRLYTGIVSFLAAHILYIFTFIGLTPKMNGVLFVCSFLPILIIEYFFIGRLHIPNRYKIPVIMYAGAIGLLIVFSLQVFMYYKSMVSILFVAGSILFFISDMVLAYFNTIKPMTKKALTGVMVSYIAAQASLVSGLLA